MIKNNDKFHCFIPVDFEKAEKDKKTGEDFIKVKGIISTADEDSQGEFLDPNGFDLTRFVSSGNINYNHQAKNDPSAIVGHPVMAKIINGNKVYMEGRLYPDLQKTKDILDLAKSLEKYGQGRKLGYSIEGKALERDPINPKRITKALITGVAITPTPVNTETSLELIKGWVDEAVENDFELDIEKSEANGGEQHIIDVTNPDTGMRYIVKKDFSIIVEKAITTTSSAKGTIKEDLEGKLNNLASTEIKKAIIVLAKASEQGKLNEENKDKVKNYIKSL